MTQPLFDFDLKCVSLEHYINGKAGISFLQSESTTCVGGAPFSYFDRKSGVVKVSLVGMHHPDTTRPFCDEGVIDVDNQLAKLAYL